MKLQTQVTTNQAKVPTQFWPKLDSLHSKSVPIVERMLQDRTKTSSKYCPEIPCVVAKSLVAKYQKNKKCKKVKSLVLPICGDKGKQVKLENGRLRIPAITKKETIPKLEELVMSMQTKSNQPESSGGAR